jgi:hypothetical protein
LAFDCSAQHVNKQTIALLFLPLKNGIIIIIVSYGTFYPQKLALTSPTSGGRSVGIVRSWTEAMEFVFCSLLSYQAVFPEI